MASRFVGPQAMMDTDLDKAFTLLIRRCDKDFIGKTIRADKNLISIIALNRGGKKRKKRNSVLFPDKKTTVKEYGMMHEAF